MTFSQVWKFRFSDVGAAIGRPRTCDARPYAIFKHEKEQRFCIEQGLEDEILIFQALLQFDVEKRSEDSILIAFGISAYGECSVIINNLPN